LAAKFDVRAATDITGFSLLGHAWEMASTSRVGLRFDWESIPFTQGAMRYAKQYIFPGGASDNRLYFQEHIKFSRKMEDYEIMLLFDPQTSGGLLLSVPEDKANSMLSEAEKVNQPMWVIGRVVEGQGIEIV